MIKFASSYLDNFIVAVKPDSNEPLGQGFAARIFTNLYKHNSMRLSDKDIPNIQLRTKVIWPRIRTDWDGKRSQIILTLHHTDEILAELELYWAKNNYIYRVYNKSIKLCCSKVVKYHWTIKFYIDHCNHLRTADLFAESINSQLGFKSLLCDTFEHFQQGLCAGNQSEFMGEHTPDR